MIEPAGSDPALRHDAERRLREREGTARDLGDPIEAQRLLHELGVHQIELEIQNEQLRQAQLELEAARDLYRDLYDRAPVGYLTVALDGSVQQANPRARELLGLPPDGPILGTVGGLISPESRPAYQEALQQMLRHGGPCAAEVLMNLPGRQRWVGVEMVLVRDGVHGRPQCRLALLDIDERVATRRGMAQLAAIVSSSSDAIIGRDAGGRVISWNAGAERLFGWSEAERLGHPLDDLVPPERRSEEGELLRRLRRGESVTGFETERRRRDGRRVPVSMTLSPLIDERGQLGGSSLIATDISDRRRAEQSQHQRLRQLDVLSQAGHALIVAHGAVDQVQQRLFDSVRLAVGAELCLHYEAHADSRTLVLKAASGMTDVAGDGLQRIGFDDSLCGLVAQRRALLVVEDLQQSMLPQAASFKARGLACYAGFPLVVSNQVLGVAAFASTSRRQFRDGDLKVIQTVCDQVCATLERDRLLHELQEREARLREADRAKDEFIATLAHELRNPLAPIRNAVNVMRVGAPGDARQAWCREVIERQVAQMSHLLEDLLDVGRISRRKVELRRRRVDLCDAVEQALETARPAIEAQQHTVEVALPRRPVLVYGDLTRLTQVFGNLIGNAAKYTDTGGRIEIVLEADDPSDAVVTVRDNGVGIEPAHLPRVFDMFSQFAPALERSRGGLGIGLALAKALVELHGGRVDAASEGRGRGSTFVVRLPRLASASAERPAEAPPVQEAPRRRVLVVDDNADAAQTLAAMIALAGHETEVAQGGAEALERAGHWAPDVGVIDIGMPGMNGYELCRRLRHQPGGEHLLLIACTGWGMEQDRERGRAAGFDHHLVKPVDANALLALIAGTAEPPG